MIPPILFSSASISLFEFEKFSLSGVLDSSIVYLTMTDMQMKSYVWVFEETSEDLSNELFAWNPPE